MNSVLNFRSISLGAVEELNESVIVSVMTYRAENRVIRFDDGHKLDVMELKCVRSMSGVIMMVKWRNGEQLRR